MPKLVLINATVHTGGIDLTSDVNKVTLAVSGDEVDATTFGSGGWKERQVGLLSADFTHAGYIEYPDPDATLFADVGQQRVLTATPDGTDGDVAYFCNAKRFAYTPIDAAIGAMANFAGTASSSDKWGLVRGRLLLPKQAIAGAHTGTGVLLGAVGAQQHVFAAVHVFAAGTTADVIVESDDNSGFTSPTTRSTTTVTALGGTFVTPVAGAITDTYWRIRTATVTGSFSIAAALGIQ